MLAVNAPPFTETVQDGRTGLLYRDPREDQGADFARVLDRAIAGHRAVWGQLELDRQGATRGRDGSIGDAAADSTINTANTYAPNIHFGLYSQMWVSGTTDSRPDGITSRTLYIDQVRVGRSINGVGYSDVVPR